MPFSCVIHNFLREQLVLNIVSVGEMHESFFSYPLTRPFPYKWFTWAVFIGGAIAVVFFSFLNLAANGYTLEVVYTTNPNATLAEAQWFQKLPWTLFEKVEASCQSQGLSLSTQLFTTQLGLTYKMSNVWSYGENGSLNISPSLTYLNHTLENCTVKNIYIHAQNSNSIGNSQFWAWLQSTISAVATCSVYNGDSTPSFFNMTVEYDASPVADSAYDNGAIGVAPSSTGFLHLDQRGKACIWWGQQLLHMWYYNTLSALAAIETDTPSASNTISTLRLFLAPGAGSQDITSYGFFNITGWLNMGDGALQAFQTEAEHGVLLTPSLGGYDIGLQLHHFASVFYSTILADLGQVAGPNVLTEKALIQQHVLEGYEKSPLQNYDATTPAQQAYSQVMAATGNLTIQPSTFYAQYICQVPRRRNAGSAFIAVLVADVVFLQTLYSMLVWTTTWWLKRKHRDMNLCEACQKNQVGGRGRSSTVELLSMSTDPDVGAAGVKDSATTRGSRSVSKFSLSTGDTTSKGDYQSVLGGARPD